MVLTQLRLRTVASRLENRRDATGKRGGAVTPCEDARVVTEAGLGKQSKVRVQLYQEFCYTCLMNANDEEMYSKFIHNTLKSKRESTDYARGQMITNLSHLREFCGTLLNINVGVIGAVIAALLTIKFETAPSTYFGVGILLLNAVFLTFYQARVLVGENARLHAWYEFLNDTHKEIINLGHSHFQKKTSYTVFDAEAFEKYKEFAEKEKSMISQNKEESLSATYIYLFCSLFVIGLIVLTLELLGSRIPFYEEALAILKCFLI